MKIKVETWTLKHLIESKGKINPKPQYQRTSVWQPPKKKLLIDSILRGYDIPKFYLRKTPNDLIHQFEVTDGQQRMRAIWEFVFDPSFKLDKSQIDDFNTENLTYNSLQANSIRHDSFLKFEITVAIIEEATQEEIRSLFARLQMGEKLNPAELRHALASNIGNAISSLIENHNFFDDNCKIPNQRYKHQDYLDNAITVSYYNGTRNVKAVDMRFLYSELANTQLVKLQPLLVKVNKVLDLMRRINASRKGIFKNKWAFVDVFYLLFKNLDHIADINPYLFAEKFWDFELLRKKYNANPQVLIEDKDSKIYNKNLYDYIMAFKADGADKTNIATRYTVFYKAFFKRPVFTLIEILDENPAKVN